MKFGGTSVADAERIKRAARRIVAKREAGHRVVAVLSARGKTTDELIAMAEEVSPAPAPARDGHAALDRRADLVRAVRDGDQRPRPRGDLADRLAGRDRHRHLAHQGAHPRRPRRPHHERARRGQDRARRRLPGRLDQPRRDDARPRRLGHDRGRASPPRSAPRSARSTPTSPASSAPTRGSCPTRASCRSSPSRRCSRCRRRAPACCSCARSSTRATTACGSTAARASTDGPGTVVVSEEETHGTPTHHRRHPLDRRGADHAARRPRPARASPAASSRRSPTPTCNVDMIIQNEPLRDGRRADMSFTVPREDGRDRPRRARAARRRARHRARSPPRSRWARSRSSAPGWQPPGRRREGLHDARRRGHQHRDDLDLADQDLLRDLRRARAGGGPRAARGVRLGADTIVAEHPFGDPR